MIQSGVINIQSVFFEHQPMEADELLVEKAQQGEHGAFEMLVEQYTPVVYRTAMRMTGARYAEDVTQEVFLQLYKSIHAFRRQSAFSTWLYRLVFNVCSNYRRRKIREEQTTQFFSEEDGVHAAAQNESDPEKNALDKCMKEELMKAVERLPEKLRAVIILRDFEGLSYDEMAHVLGCPVGTVRSRLHHATRELAQKLEAFVKGEKEP